MGSWPSALLSRVGALVLLGLFATATITFAATKKIEATATPAAAPAEAPAATTLVVPDVRGQAYVFAKGILEDAGFAWRVASANGYAANTVAVQSPAAGVRVIDNGSPTIVLSLQKNPHYAQKGTPENASPFAGSDVHLVAAAAAPARAATTRPAAKAQPAAKPQPAAKERASTKPEARKPEFLVTGAPKEPQHELPLPVRAKKLAAWLETHRSPTDANVDHWLYQHEWIVTGAKFGWWHGAEALEILIEADRRAEKLWGVGSRSEAAARQALAEVEARTR
jgi:hypothetical protein